MATATKEKKKLHIHPLPGRILVEEDRPAKKIGLIHIPENAQKLPSIGVVVDIHPDTQTCLVVGDRIVYNMFSGTAIVVKGMENRYRTLVPDECLATLEPETEIEETGA